MPRRTGSPEAQNASAARCYRGSNPASRAISDPRTATTRRHLHRHRRRPSEELPWPTRRSPDAQRTSRGPPVRLPARLFRARLPRAASTPGVLDLTFGNPHDPAPEEYVEALRASAVPRDEHWFGYKVSEPAARAAAAASLRTVVDLPFEPDDVHLTTGGFTALALALKLVADPGTR
ncbi:hypothetical protein NKG05_07255 [Oerskovia sp. M15]